jgi:hypothetical protein
MNNTNAIPLSDYANLLSNKDAVPLDEYLATYKSRIAQESEELFVRDFLFSLFVQKYKIFVERYDF